MTDISRQATPPFSLSLRRPALVVCLVLSVVIVVVYARSLGNGPVWDDGVLVTDNANLRSLAGLWRVLTEDLFAASDRGEPSSFYRPFAMLTFAIGNLIGGTGTAAARFGNIALHAVNAMLLAALIHRMTRVGWRTAGLVAMGWALAPVCSEPVLWISGRFDLLVVTFALLALVGSRIENRAGSAIVLIAVGAGLFSKESFAGILPLLLVDDLLVRRRPVRTLWAKYLTIAVIAVAYFACRRHIGIMSLGAAAFVGPRALVESFLFLVGSFLRVLVWPDNLDPIRPYVALSGARLALSAGVLIGTVAAGATWFARARDNDNARAALFSIAWFVLATLPSAVIGPDFGLIGDRYAYLPLTGLFIATGAIAAEIGSRQVFRRATIVPGLVAVIVCVAEGCVVVRHTPNWSDEESLQQSSLRSTPENYYALYLLGSDAARRGDVETADRLLARSLAGSPESWRTWNAICFVRLGQNRLPEAEQACIRSLARNGQNPRAWVNLASTYARLGRWVDALATAERAVALKQRYVEPEYVAAWAAANLGDFSRAQAHIARGMQIAPDHPGLRDLQRQIARK